MAKKTDASKNPFAKLISGLLPKKPGTEQASSSAPNLPPVPSLRLVVFIIDWAQAHVISSLLEEEKVRFHFITKGMGTIRNEILDLLGIGVGEKAVIVCLEQAVLVRVLMKEARKKLGFYNPSAGIAFTISLSAINDPLLLVFKQSIHKNEKIAAELKLNEGVHMAENFSSNAITHDLVVAIVNHGFSSDVIYTAQKAGASGGTVINARGQAHEGAIKFFGISVQDEKEMVLILTAREKKVAIMRAISEEHGLNSEAHGLVVSLPVDDVMGLV